MFLLFVGVSFALTWTMSSGRYQAKNFLPPHKPFHTYLNPTRTRIVNNGQPMVMMGGASPPISPNKPFHTSKKCLCSVCNQPFKKIGFYYL